MNNSEYDKRLKIETRVFDIGALNDYRFVVIFARYNGMWIYSRRHDRDTWETAGGHIEPGESPDDAARRELWEETGSVKFDIQPAFDYSVHTPTEFSNGRVYFAEVYELGKLPDFEMSEITTSNTYPEKLTYPEILPVLFKQINKVSPSI